MFARNAYRISRKLILNGRRVPSAGRNGCPRVVESGRAVTPELATDSTNRRHRNTLGFRFRKKRGLSVFENNIYAL